MSESSSAPSAPSAASKPETVKKAEETNVADLSSMLADTALLDMVFVMDATGSMSSYIQTAQQTIRSVVQEIVAAEKADVRFAVVSYRDHPPQESTYVTNVFDFTKSIGKMRENLDTLSAHGGGDGPEAVADGLQAVLKLDFRPEATKVCILIADAPPHGLAPSGDGFPNGCPCGFDPVAVCRSMAEEGITLYCIGCEPSLTPYKAFFMALANITGGQYCALGNAVALSSAVVSGVREEISLEKMMSEVRMNLADVADRSEEEQAALLQARLRAAGTRAKHLRRDGGSNEALTPDAVLMSKAATLSEARSCFAASSPAPAMAHAMAPKSSMRRAMPAMACAAPMSYAGPAPACGAPAFASAAPASTPTSYSVVEDEVSMAQCDRLMHKSKARAMRDDKRK